MIALKKKLLSEVWYNLIIYDRNHALVLAGYLCTKDSQFVKSLV